MEKSWLLSPYYLHYLIFFVSGKRRSLRSRLKGQILVHGTHDIASLVLCFLAPISSLVGNNEIGWKNAGSFRQDLLSLEEVGPLLREQLVLHHLTGLLASVAQEERGEGSLFVYMYIHISWREKTRKKRV